MSLEKIRAYFPHTDHLTYLNHAATGPLSTPVVNAIQGFVEQRHRTLIENFFEFQPVIAETREKLARLLGTHARNIEFVTNTSQALNVLTLGIQWQEGDRVAVPGCEFPANVYPFMNLERLGVRTDLIPHEESVVSTEAIADALTPRTRLLSLSWVQFLSGYRSDLVEVGRICKEREILFCVDAIQGLGALQLPGPIDDCGIDFLACGGHKWLMGTQGLGFLYVSDALLERLTPAMAGWAPAHLVEEGDEAIVGYPVGLAHLLVDPSQSSRQPILVERLQEIVDRNHVEGPQRVLVVRRDEDDRRHLIGADRLDHAEPVAVRHLNVEKDHVRIVLANGLDRFVRIRALRHHLDIDVRLLLRQHGPE